MAKNEDDVAQEIVTVLWELQRDAKPIRRKRATPPVIRATDQVNQQTIEQLRADLARAAASAIATLAKTPRPARSTEPQDDASKRFRLLELD